MKTIIKSNYEPIPRYVSVVLGQRLENGRVGTLPEESFSGRFADFTIYRGQLDLEDVQKLANCQKLNEPSLILDWFVSSYQLVGDVRIEDLPKSSFCPAQDTTLATDTAIFNHGISHDYAKFVCQKLGGQLPTLGRNLTEKQSLYNSLKDKLLDTVSNFTCTVSEDSNTDGRNTDVTVSIAISVEEPKEVYFWTGITEDPDTEVYLNEYTKEPIQFDPNIYPGPVGNFSCTMARGPEFLVRKDCLDLEPCAICQVQRQKRLRLKGLCVEDLRKDSDFDTEFYSSGIFNERLYFRGIRASHIFVDPVDGKWTLQSLKNPGKISKLDIPNTRYPIGRHRWTVQNNETQYGICGLENGGLHLLTFSDCHPEKFTCNR